VPSTATALQFGKSPPPLENSTVPTVTGLPPELTAAVKVTELFGGAVNDGFGDDPRVVVVAAAEANAVKFAVTLSAAFMVIEVLADVGLATESGLDVHPVNT
jgi:hypothetical protein